MSKRPVRRRLELVRPDYQPTKAEMEEAIDLRREDGRKPTPLELAMSVLQPTEISYIKKPRK